MLEERDFAVVARHRRLWTVGLVLAVLVASGSAENPDAMAMLDQALEHYAHLRFAEAHGLLQQVDGEALSASDQDTLESYLAWTETAMARQSEALAALADGGAAAAAEHWATAEACLIQAADCEFLQPEARQQAQDQLAVVQSHLTDAQVADGDADGADFVGILQP